MLARLVVAVLLSMLSCAAFALEEPRWIRTLAGGGNRVNDFAVAADGSIFFTGMYSKGGGYYGMSAGKLTPSGTVSWIRHYGGYDSNGWAIVLTPDGGAVVTGGYRECCFTTGQNLMKLSADGSVEWNKVFVNSAWATTDSRVIALAGGGYLLTGYVYANPVQWWVARLDANANVLWQKRYARAQMYGDEYVKSAIQTSDGGFALVGELKDESGNSLASVAKLDANGNVSWQKRYSFGEVTELAVAIEEADNGQLLVLGTGGGPILMMLTSSGAPLWQKRYATGGWLQGGQALHRGQNDTWLVLAYGMDSGAWGEPYLLSTDDAGTPQWTVEIGTAGRNDFGERIRQTPDGSIIVQATLWVDGLSPSALLKLDSDGALGRDCSMLQPYEVTADVPAVTVTNLTPFAFNTTFVVQEVAAAGSLANATMNEICSVPPDIAVPDTSFGASVGSTDTKTIDVSNAGGGTLTITGVSSPATPFAIVSDGCTGAALQAGMTCPIVVSYAPSGAGPHESAFAIESSDDDEQVVVVTVTGRTQITPPSALSASWSGSSMTVSWNASPDASSYEIFRAHAGTYTLLTTIEGTSFVDASAQAGSAYAYKVRARSGTLTSAFTAADAATAMMFADDPLVPSSTPVRALHYTQLLAGANALRAAAGLPSVAFDQTVSAGGTVFRSQLEDLRDAMAQARTALSLSPMNFTDSPLAAGDRVKAVHVMELRNALR
jgi:hypothetical protein